MGHFPHNFSKNLSKKTNISQKKSTFRLGQAMRFCKNRPKPKPAKKKPPEPHVACGLFQESTMELNLPEPIRRSISFKAFSKRLATERSPMNRSNDTHLPQEKHWPKKQDGTRGTLVFGSDIGASTTHLISIIHHYTHLFNRDPLNNWCFNNNFLQIGSSLHRKWVKKDVKETYCPSDDQTPFVRVMSHDHSIGFQQLHPEFQELQPTRFK